MARLPDPPKNSKQLKGYVTGNEVYCLKGSTKASFLNLNIAETVIVRIAMI